MLPRFSENTDVCMYTCTSYIMLRCGQLHVMFKLVISPHMSFQVLMLVIVWASPNLSNWEHLLSLSHHVMTDVPEVMDNDQLEVMTELGEQELPTAFSSSFISSFCA